ncbi:hypothetical protein Kpol_1018p141 [Vanderwaltozyma polyspora DSM 70294]|uniref:Protein NNF2 n=1 Tax=Vanderwaltozyma polyspora (strain ATCC 22028 / DSM 70294 / BCRC 21397 / CBS 2163 / NBRC 10782 / NRRL Y-8283 / UCD 57-17) TaxID=436907 RepID=A7TDY3_VANPO|nr:uncharacterized protein Kpol_1018p141 [Vanderwaltozyma polyspora DSM 70294]EDO19603.1 hypothetical protein Kpol_1018p141 [Vanderwaltozyma polyspora DSM 70294]
MKIANSYRLLDTFALFLIFYNFNNFYLVILLSFFIIASVVKNFIAHVFIVLFLSKRPSKVDFTLSKERLRDRNCLFYSLIVTLITSTLLRYYFNSYFYIPVKVFAISIVSSSMINEPRNRIYIAFLCFCSFLLFTYLENLPIVKLTLLSLQRKSLVYKYVSTAISTDFHFSGFNFLNFGNNHWIHYENLLQFTLCCNIIVSQILKDLFRKSSSSSSGESRIELTEPIFESNIKDFKFYEPNVTNYNSQAVSTTAFSTISNSMNEETNTWKNKFFELLVTSDDHKENEIAGVITETSNLENFIRHLFQWKKNYLISPLWSMFVTLKATNFEKKYLKEVTTAKNLNTGSTTSNNDDLSPTFSASSIEETSNLQNKSLFDNSLDVNNMELIVQTASDDYDQLNLISSNENIFSRGENEYKICITDIGSHSITFHIENLSEGQLIVLVNGVIWSEVSCALIFEREFEQFVVVNGLVPSCSYDIQFINRLNQTDDHLISDIVVRTRSLKIPHEDFDNNIPESSSINENESLENIDFSFPSYYHRKFLSPLLTLKHSVLTTNTNLSEERIKLKKTKKEINKKLNTLRQEIDHIKSKMNQNALNDEKSTSKIDGLKTTLQQNEALTIKLETQLKALTDKELQLESDHLKQKDQHLKRSLEYSKLEESLKEKLAVENKQLTKLQTEYNQLASRNERLTAMHDKLMKEVSKTSEESESLKNQFIQLRESDRQRRKELRAQTANEFELAIKGLEQDISRLESENSNMKMLMTGY